MRRLLGTLATFTLLAFPAAQADPDVAAAPPLTPQVQNGVTFLSGGIGDSEQASLLRMNGDYNVRIALTNADGTYLSRIHLVIESTSGKPLVTTTTRGPIVLAQLAPGRYVVRAEAEGRTSERRVIDVPKQKEDQVRLYVALVEESEGSSS